MQPTNITIIVVNGNAIRVKKRLFAVFFVIMCPLCIFFVDFNLDKKQNFVKQKVGGGVFFRFAGHAVF